MIPCQRWRSGRDWRRAVIPLRDASTNYCDAHRALKTLVLGVASTGEVGRAVNACERCLSYPLRGRPGVLLEALRGRR